MLSLVWFKRDLRVIDHPALSLAAAQGQVLPVYISEPDLWAQPDASARHWGFLGECIEELRRDLAALGQPLILREGDAVEVLARLQAKHKFTQIVSHSEGGNAWSQRRDQRVAAWARDKGLAWVQLPHSGVPPGAADGLAQRRAYLRHPMAEVTALPPVAEGTGALPSARALRLADDHGTARQVGGRAAGMLALEGFLTTRGQGYRTATASALTAERGCSRVSPYLTYGAISLREVAQLTAEAKTARRGQGAWTTSLRRFDQALALRDQPAQAFIEPPKSETCTEPDTRGGHYSETSDAGRLAAWQNGETGLPFVDAAIRYLHISGWLSAPLRAMLQSVAVQHLLLDWRVSGLHLARMFTDYDPGIHWAHVQAGGEGGQSPRIIDPIKLGRAQDPNGAFIRRWLPELARVPDAFVHEPWKWPPACQVLAGRYPEPIIDPVSALRTARARRAAHRPMPKSRASVLTPPAPRPGAQMWLDL